MTKAELRKIYLAKRRTLSANEIETASEAIADRFFDSFNVSGIRVLHTFIPIQKFAEINTMKICERVWRDFPHTTIAVPKLNLEIGEMFSAAITPETELHINKWGIPEPEHADPVSAAEIDAVLLPGLCFDRRGHRVGYGKGFYDRFLTTTREDCSTVGLSYFDLVETIDDIHDGDIAVDSVITPEELFRF